MYISLKKVVLVLVSGILFLACKQERKSENQAEKPEIAATTMLAKSRYVIGDSIHLGFSKPVQNTSILFDGENINPVTGKADSLLISTKTNKTGWHQLIVRGSTQDKTEFADTLRVELLSDIVPTEIKYTVLANYPHQKSSFTEGLEFYKGVLYEGTGQNGQSKLLKIDLKTGATKDSVTLEEKYFGEGITIVNDKIYQLTWQSGVCFRYDMNFKPDKTFTYYTQGWGMTHNEKTLIMSDGSNKLYFYNTEMEKIGEVEVYDHTGPILKLNELEYVDGVIYANIFESTKIVKIDPVSGKVIGFMKMDGIVPAATNVNKDVLNGIAHQPFENGLYITGKNWPLIFKIKLSETKTRASLSRL